MYRNERGAASSSVTWSEVHSLPLWRIIRKRLPSSVFPGFSGFKVEIRPGTPGFQLPPSNSARQRPRRRVFQCEQTRGQTGNRIKFRLPALHTVSVTPLFALKALMCRQCDSPERTAGTQLTAAGFRAELLFFLPNSAYICSTYLYIPSKNTTLQPHPPRDKLPPSSGSGQETRTMKDVIQAVLDYYSQEVIYYTLVFY